MKRHLSGLLDRTARLVGRLRVECKDRTRRYVLFLKIRLTKKGPQVLWQMAPRTRTKGLVKKAGENLLKSNGYAWIGCHSSGHVILGIHGTMTGKLRFLGTELNWNQA